MIPAAKELVVCIVVGTRPEAIKLAPVIWELRRCGVEVRVLSTGQHHVMLNDALEAFEIEADVKLSVMRSGASLAELTANLVGVVSEAVAGLRPDVLVVQGDTTSALAGALAGHYNRVPVGHVEAGLRSHDRYSPFPEEMNRRLIGQLSQWHYCPTERSRINLLNEGVDPMAVLRTGNTCVDTLLWSLAGRTKPSKKACGRRVLVTLHRRENQGAVMAGIATALRILGARPDVEVLLPLHPSPAVRDVLVPALAGRPGVVLCEPLSYLELVGALSSCDLVLTDSGGIQEEAPTLGKPVLVLRDTTERPEAIEAGVARLIGTDPSRIVAAASELLDDPEKYAAMARPANPFGDGHAAERIARHLLASHSEIRK